MDYDMQFGEQTEAKQSPDYKENLATQPKKKSKN